MGDAAIRGAELGPAVLSECERGGKRAEVS